MENGILDPQILPVTGQPDDYIQAYIQTLTSSSLLGNLISNKLYSSYISEVEKEMIQSNWDLDHQGLSYWQSDEVAYCQAVGNIYVS